MKSLAIALLTLIATTVVYGYQDTFNLDNCHLRARGVNHHFIPLKPGYCMLYEGEDDGEEVELLITVLKRTKIVDGIRCAIVKEMEWKDGELYEISWNYFAICRKTKAIFYFGEDVNFYEDGRVVGHDGAWLAGTDGAVAGLIMPGFPVLGARYYQEIAPGVALDRAEHVSVTAEIETEAGEFENCLSIVETNPVEPGDVTVKFYAPGVGMVKDGSIELVEFGVDLLEENGELDE